MGSKAGIVAIAAMYACTAYAQAQDPTNPDAALPGRASVSEACASIAGMFVDVALLDPIGSATATRGQRFRIELLAPLLVDGLEVLPAGTPGEGEVIHADRSRGGGKPGELLLAARYLEHAGHRIGLRGMKMGGRGDDRTGAAMATSFAVGPFAHFVKGREIEIPAGTPAHARLSADASLPCSAGAPAPDPAPTTDDASMQAPVSMPATPTTTEE